MEIAVCGRWLGMCYSRGMKYIFLLNKILKFVWSENMRLLHETEGNYELDLSPCKNLFSVTLSFSHQLVFVSGNQ